MLEYFQEFQQVLVTATVTIHISDWVLFLHLLLIYINCKYIIIIDTKWNKWFC